MNKSRILIGTTIGLFVLMALIVDIRMMHILKPEEDSEQRKTVLCVKINDKANGTMVVNEMDFDDCGKDLISYNADKQTFLYINQKRHIIERDINEEITYNAVMFQYSNMYNLQYTPEESKISFVFDHDLYHFDCIKGQSHKLIEGCVGSKRRNTYWLQSEEEIYFIDYDEKQQQRNLYFQDGQQKRRIVKKGIESFCASSDGTRLYCIQSYTVPTILGVNTKYRIIEIDLLNDRNRILQEISSDNFVLKDVDNKYLLYVEESNEKGRTKVFQLDLESCKTKCIYRTNKKVIGIVT